MSDSGEITSTVIAPGMPKTPSSTVSPSASPPAPPISVQSTPSPLPTGNNQIAEVPTTSQNSLPVTHRSSAPSEKPVSFVGDFFKIHSVKLITKEPRDGVGVWKFEEIKKRQVATELLPSLVIEVGAQENIRSDKLTAKAYFFDQNNNLVANVSAPSKAGKRTQRNHFAMPVLFHKNQATRIFFAVPENLAGIKWKAVVVFGDKFEAQSACYPNSETDFLLSYPEKALVYDRSAKQIVRKPAMDPLIEHVIKTNNPKNPKITLFLRPPLGVDDANEIKGLIAISLLANSVDDIKRQLQQEEMSGDYNGLLRFANKHKLAVLAWGSTSALWNRENYDTLSAAKARETNQSFRVVANAWERGVLELGEKYGIPTKNFLLWGQCGSAHWAHALCLYKPDYFLAIAVHIPGYFERPTAEAAKVLWCITTGELYSAHENSLRFLEDCKKLGYPIVYKAIVGLGHAGHPDATEMGFKFFEFALSQKKLRDDYDKIMADTIMNSQLTKSEKPVPWPEAFQDPPYYADIINQEIYPAKDVDMIPEAFRIPIPTKEIGTIWKKDN